MLIRGAVVVTEFVVLWWQGWLLAVVEKWPRWSCRSCCSCGTGAGVVVVVVAAAVDVLDAVVAAPSPAPAPVAAVAAVAVLVVIFMVICLLVLVAIVVTQRLQEYSEVALPVHKFMLLLGVHTVNDLEQ